MRLFIAIVPPSERLAELVGLQKLLLPKKAAGPDRLVWDSKEGRLLSPAGVWRPAPAGQMHLTLQFLGDDITLHKAHDVEMALQQVAKRHAPFDVAAAGAGAFPRVERANVLWAGLEGEGVKGLAQDIEQTLAQIGIKRDKPFAPHMTIARSKTPQNAQELLRQMEGKKWSEQKWQVEEFVLFESKHILQGREHCALQTCKLTG